MLLGRDTITVRQWEKKILCKTMDLASYHDCRTCMLDSSYGVYNILTLIMADFSI